MKLFETLGRSVGKFTHEAKRSAAAPYTCNECGKGFYIEQNVCPECGSQNLTEREKRMDANEAEGDESMIDDRSNRR
ncbi:zinc ribbon domain-containing protein [Halosolutus gelatinilyticus]|uniref:zinc ribbon domain-containing protein n=1 Tax=Halosolutus gelatinilyticus TaxID=2931975 RepID=UPI001FF57C69|nr:zinc ribbon domain-containing protein [Halosolutus gelatinilyticus]